MQRVQQVYTQCVNRKYTRTGHVFQQRYKALFCDKENYLLQLIKYIHNNSVKANLEKGIEYQWSSYIYYIMKKKSDIVDTSFVLSMFSENINKAIVLLSEKYCNASNKILSQKLNISSSMISKIKAGDSIGTAYVKEVIERWEGIS